MASSNSVDVMQAYPFFPAEIKSSDSDQLSPFTHRNPSRFSERYAMMITDDDLPSFRGPWE